MRPRGGHRAADRKVIYRAGFHGSLPLLQTDDTHFHWAKFAQFMVIKELTTVQETVLPVTKTGPVSECYAWVGFEEAA